MKDYERVVQRIRRAAVADRIEFRDELVALGADAIPRLTELMQEPGSGGVAISALERLATGTARTQAIPALRSVRDLLPGRRAEIDAALERVGAREPRLTSRQRRTAERLNNVATLPESAGVEWPGFQAKEFGRIAGAVWRSRDGRKSLAPMIVRGLHAQHEHFDSFGVERRPQIHFFVSDRYRWAGNRESGWRAAKLVVYAHGPIEEEPDVPSEVVAGLYVEKTNGKEPFGPLTEQWDWVWFVRALRRNDVQLAMTETMAKHDLRIGDYRGLGYTAATAVGRVGFIRNGTLVAAEGGPAIDGWDGFADHLEQLPEDSWHDLHIWKSWSAEEAIEAGQPFAMSSIFPVLHDLAEVYLMVMQEALAPGDQNYRIVRRRRDGIPAQLEFAVHAHEQAGHFSVPTAVMRELNIPDDAQVRLNVRADGTMLYAGTLRMRSKNEVYPLVDEPSRAGLEQIEPKQLLHVLIEKAPAD
jgi:hypothetical protein